MKTVGISAPSNWIQADRLNKGVRTLQSLGVQIRLHPQVMEQHFQSAGTHDVRADALISLYADKDVDIIMATAGGHRALHLMPLLDYHMIEQHNKPLIGFSDTTALLNAIFAKTGNRGIYGPPVASLADGISEADTQSLKTFLTEGHITADLRLTRLNTALPHQEATHFIGGNLCLFTNLMNTPYQPNLSGAVLLLEDDGEEIRNIDRMLLHLKNQGVFDKVSAVLLGDFTSIKDTEYAGRPFTDGLNTILAEHLKDAPCPVYTGAPFGHGERLSPLPIGYADIQLREDGLSFKVSA